MIKRFDRLDIATTDAADAAATFEKNFGLVMRRPSGLSDPTITIGDAEIRLRSGAAVADVIATAGEGLGAVWLEADDLDQVVVALTADGTAFTGPRVEDGRRILEVDSKAANMVALFIFDRRA
jgi:hypothetical protein